MFVHLKLLPFLFAILLSSAMAEETLFYVSSNDGSVNEPLFLCALDNESGAIRQVEAYSYGEEAVAASYLCLNSKRTHLYTVVGGNPNRVSAWKIEKDGKLELMNQVESGGRGSCHLSLSNDEKSLFVANYSSGQVSVVSISETEILGDVRQVLTLKGSGPNLSRQKASHMHYINTTLDGKMVMANDLGTDRIQLYNYDNEAARLRVNPNQNALSVAPGAGPRHLAFHNNGLWIYLLNELDATVDLIEYDSTKGTLKKVTSNPLLPADFEGFNKSAAIHIQPNGKFLYASNRGDSDSITIFKINQNDGSLQQVDMQADGVNWPRDFNIDPSGKYLISAGAKSNELSVFQIDPNTGTLTPTEHKLNLPKPVCVVF